MKYEYEHKIIYSYFIRRRLAFTCARQSCMCICTRPTRLGMSQDELSKQPWVDLCKLERHSPRLRFAQGHWPPTSHARAVRAQTRRASLAPATVRSLARSASGTDSLANQQSAISSTRSALCLCVSICLHCGQFN